MSNVSVCSLHFTLWITRIILVGHTYLSLSAFHLNNALKGFKSQIKSCRGGIFPSVCWNPGCDLCCILHMVPALVNSFV